MILSRSRNFVFIKGRKVAGTSVEMALSTICGPQDIVTPITPRDERERLAMGGRPANFANIPAAEKDYIAAVSAADTDALTSIRHPPARFANHMPLSAVVALEPEAAAMPLVFVERCLYAKVISLANHQRRFADYQRGGDMSGGDEASLREAATAVLASRTLAQVHNIKAYRDPDHGLRGTRLRYEHLTGDFAAFLRKLGVEPMPLPFAKRGSRSNAHDPRSIFSREALDHINALFADEFEAFGYEMI